MSKTAHRFIPKPASIVCCRTRQWVVLPSEDPEIIRLRPLNGDEALIGGIYLPLEINTDTLTPAEFPLPQPQIIQDHTAAQLLLNAARFSLRSGGDLFAAWDASLFVLALTKLSLC